MQDIEVVKVVKIWGLINSYLMGQIGITAKSYLSWVCVCPGTINIYNTLTLIKKNMNCLFYIYNFKKFTPKSHQIFSLFLKERSTLMKLYFICNIWFWMLAQNLCYNIFSFLCNVSVFQISVCFVIVSLSAHIPAWTDKCKLQLDRFSSLNFSRNFRSFLNGNYMYWCQT